MKHETEEKSTIFQILIEAGCCKRCSLRYSGQDCNGEINKITHIQDVKRKKLNPCVVCLDLLSDFTIENVLGDSVLDKVLEYDSNNFTNFISYPPSVLIREHSMEIYMNEKFPTFFKDAHITPMNRAWSLSVQDKLAKKFNKRHDRMSLLQVQINTNYEFDKEESSVMFQLNEKKQNNVLSRNSIVEFLKTVDAETFKKFVPVPPLPSSKPLTIDEITIKHDFIYIAGRYCKFSRELFQTPWLSEDEAPEIKGSVQEIIFQALNNIFNCSSMIFSSSGREDFDVRTLGRGRPFFIKITDPKITLIPFDKFRLIEKTINRSKVIQVRDLQIIDRKSIANIKDGEQFKQKSYRALCILEGTKNIGSFVEKINATGPITLLQKTPLRVFHRRSADCRKREIYDMKARIVSGRDNLFELDVVTQAGTYVKEFVHGDLGRTTPSLNEIIGVPVDIIALDVLDIYLDFPPSINYKK